jgi:hypothetical protein
MNPSDYRRDYAAFCSAVGRERFNRQAGINPQPNLQPIEERYADLWTREVIEELRRAFNETPAQFETERAGLRALVGAAQVKHARESVREVSGELCRCLESARVDWDGSKVAAEEARELIAVASDATRRHELARRWLDAARTCDDLRAARLEALDDATHTLGFDGRRALYESFTGADIARLAEATGIFLERTEAAYMTRLAEWAAREMPSGSRHQPEYAEQFFFARAARFDAYFSAQGFRAAYEETLAGLGVRPGSQGNLLLDDDPRSLKGACSACFAIKPPEDVRLVVGARPGSLDFFRRTFHEGGRAQMFAWASRETSARHPEFVHAPDAATVQGHGELFSGLVRETAWLAGRRSLRATAAQEAARFVALVELHDARRACARLRYALALDEAKDARSEQLAETYVALFGGATGFRHHAATRLLDADEDFTSAIDLRARLFAAGLREHLRSRHGRRWYATRAAGDELIDIWNTASRHAVEELARLVWGGEPSFDLLADVLVAALDGNDDG